MIGLMITLGHYNPERHVDQDGNDVVAGDNTTTTALVATNSPSGWKDNTSALRVPLPLNKYKPGMRPNCYTYSAVTNALAKSCSTLHVVSNGGLRRKQRRSRWELWQPSHHRTKLKEEPGEAPAATGGCREYHHAVVYNLALS